MRQRKPVEPISLITELKRLRMDAHDRLQQSEYEFFQVDRALNAAKRRQREREVQE